MQMRNCIGNMLGIFYPDIGGLQRFFKYKIHVTAAFYDVQQIVV